MYPVPTKPETQGLTDAAVNMFLRGRRREEVVLATKVAGRSDRINWLPRRKPETPARVTKEQIIDSVDASLKRLGTDYIDLLQIHWPGESTRISNMARTQIQCWSSSQNDYSVQNATSVDCLDNQISLHRK
mmetsp:Transcript_8241/g.19111  ORF Transcript_8241/g.19111 Transcript_8241/m.19111 type:complete len:131 (+) Transcript_8241:127-519(+)